MAALRLELNPKQEYPCAYIDKPTTSQNIQTIMAS